MIGHPLRVRELLDEIDRSQVLLPEIQRSYVWKGPQAAKLIDSLYREYPAGQSCCGTPPTYRSRKVSTVWLGATLERRRPSTARSTLPDRMPASRTSDWLPSLNALIPLAAYFAQHPAIAPDVERGLLRWFYLASMRGRYSGSPETAMDEDLKAVVGPDPVGERWKNAMPVAGADKFGAEEFDDASRAAARRAPADPAQHGCPPPARTRPLTGAGRVPTQDARRPSCWPGRGSEDRCSRALVRPSRMRAVLMSCPASISMPPGRRALTPPDRAG